MNLLKELLVGIMESQRCEVRFNIEEEDLLAAIETVCFKTLEKIRQIVQNDSLTDFETIEQIVSLFEKLNMDFGSRHDFNF